MRGGEHSETGPRRNARQSKIMSLWKKRIEFRSRLGHVVVASIVGCIVQLAEVPALAGTSVVFSGWMIALAVGLTCLFFFVPIYVAMFLSWSLRPVDGHPTGWQYVALGIAAMIGGVGQFLIVVFFLPLFIVEGPVALFLWYGMWFTTVALAMWVLRLMRPHGPRPRLRSKRQRRMLRGECLECGYNLEGNVSGVCVQNTGRKCRWILV